MHFLSLESEVGVTILSWLGGVIFSFWILAFGLMIFGTWLAHRKLSESPPFLDAPFALYPVSILKPLKGLEPGLLENLNSFFKQDYPLFELIFSVASPFDPALLVVQELQKKYPKVFSRVFVGETKVGENPKINNLLKGYEESRFDLILISDSNVRVAEDFVRRQVAHLDNGVGVVTALVHGTKASGCGGYLENTYLNTFYARWMWVAEWFGHPCVVGKSMLFKKSVAKRFGGIRALAGFLAEDYMTGVAMRQLGLKAVVSSTPVPQFVGDYSFRQFWSRHLRWGRIRKAQSPLGFLVEPMSGMFLCGMFGALGIFGLGWPAGVLPFLAMHLFIWLFCDLLLLRKLNGPQGLRKYFQDLFFILIREALAFSLWTVCLSGSTVEWRGQKIRVFRGGLIEPRKA